MIRSLAGTAASRSIDSRSFAPNADGDHLWPPQDFAGTTEGRELLRANVLLNPRLLFGHDCRYFCVPLPPFLAANDGGRMGRVNGRA